MICKRCETENPENAVFCIHCGKRLDGRIECPSCKEMCPEEALFCPMCGARLGEEAHTADTKKPEAKEESKTEDKASRAGKVKKALDLSGGICLMVGVLFALVFVLCMGLCVTVPSGTSFHTKSVMLWDFFGPEQAQIPDLLKEDLFTGYELCTLLLPMILSTVISAGSLVCVIVFTVITAILFARHLENPEVEYKKFAIAAILSFVLGASALLAVNYAIRGVSDITLTFSKATLAGIILCSIFLGSYYILKNVALGKEFLKARTIVDFVSTTCAVLFLILAAVFAVRPALNITSNTGYSFLDAETNFMGFNTFICGLFDTWKRLPEHFAEAYALSAVAQVAGIVLVVFIFVTLIKKFHAYGEESSGHLGYSITLFTLAAVYLMFYCLSFHFGKELLSSSAFSDSFELSIAAAPIAAVVMAAFVLATSITHKVLLKKTAAK